MSDNQYQSDAHRTFSQRYGYVPLPDPMQMEQVSDDLRIEIWNAIREILLSIRSYSLQEYSNECYFHEESSRFIERALGRVLIIAEDEIDTTYDEVFSQFKTLILQGSFNEVLDLVEIVANNRPPEDGFVNRISNSFERCAAAYWLDKSNYPYQFFPRSSKAQGEATQEAIKTIRDGGMEGAATHLRDAAAHINAQQFADSISDSIHAVESVARQIDPKSKTLGPALNSLEKAGLIKHPALKEAFSKLYGYTSDEQGIRHALLEKNSPDVDLDEAMFIFGACASFAAYLVNKHHKMQEEDDE
ncbi:MAG: hypothetical protein F4X51_06505 [Gemmatimonadetes bacterium]|nr:hypothetical protein [Gemmatimonadota bacterium]